MFFIAPERVSPWMVFSGWLLGAGIAYSTVVRGLMREAMPFLNRRGSGNINDGSHVDTLPPTVEQPRMPDKFQRKSDKRRK